MKHYMMILRAGHEFSEIETRELAGEIPEWVNLARKSVTHLDPRMVTRCVSCIAFSEGALVTQKEAEDPWITAIIHFDAERDDEAELIAGLHPALRHGATIELREWAAPGLLADVTVARSDWNRRT